MFTTTDRVTWSSLLSTLAVYWLDTWSVQDWALPPAGYLLLDLMQCLLDFLARGSLGALTKFVTSSVKYRSMIQASCFHYQSL